MASKFKPRGTWREKLEKAQEPKVCAIPPGMAKRLGEGTLLIPRPLDVDGLMRRVRKGKLATQAALREKLARDHGADTACPITTGIFVRIAAETAEEDARGGRKDITPYWRVVRDDGSLIEKFPGGPAAQAHRLEAEGHEIEPGKGKKPPHVRGFDAKVMRFE